MIRLLYVLFVNSDLSVADELILPDYVEHSLAPGMSAEIPGSESYRTDYNVNIFPVLRAQRKCSFSIAIGRLQ